MKILLVNPKIPRKFRMYDFADEEGKRAIMKRVLVGPPLALNEFAGMVPEEDVIILDQKAEHDMNSEYDDIAGLEEELDRFQPEMVCFTVLTAQYNTVLKLIEVVKNRPQPILTTVGGIHPTSCPEEFIQSKVDVIAIGLGKHSFYHMVQEVKKNGPNADLSWIPGLALNDGEKLYYTKPLGEIGFKEFTDKYYLNNTLPNRALTDKYDYRIPRLNKKVHYISTAQGCTHKCNFCFLWNMTDGRYFQRDVEEIISELKTMEDYPVIRFCDAHTLGDPNRAKVLFERIIEEKLNHHIYVADVRTDLVNQHPELMTLGAKAGLKVVICGLESADDETLKKYGKSNTIQTTENALRILNEAGMYVSGNYIVHPDFEERDFEILGRFVQKNPIFHSGFTILTPFPGTEQWEELKDQIVIDDYDYYNLTNAVLETKLPEREFYRQVSELYKISGRSTKVFYEKYGNPLGM